MRWALHILQAWLPPRGKAPASPGGSPGRKRGNPAGVSAVPLSGLSACLQAFSGRQLLAALGPAARKHLAAAGGRHAGTEAMAALPHELARLIGALHGPILLTFRAFRRGAGVLGRVLSSV